MIPKIIHYTWFSGEEMPEKLKACLESWKMHLPDYEFVMWDAEALSGIDNVFMKEALSCRKWAYAADFVRLYALYHSGGIYLDTDVMLYRDFDDLLANDAFIGKENSVHFEDGMTECYLSSHCFGACAEHPFIKKCLDFFSDRHFILSNDETLPATLRYNMVLLPYVQSEIAKGMGHDASATKKHEGEQLPGLTVYPSCFFDPQYTTADSYCRHLAIGGWREYEQYNPRPTLAYKIQWRWADFLHRLLGKDKYAVIKLH